MCQPRGAVAGGLIQDLDNCSVMAVDCEDRRYCFQITTPNGKSYATRVLCGWRARVVTPPLPRASGIVALWGGCFMFPLSTHTAAPRDPVCRVPGVPAWVCRGPWRRPRSVWEAAVGELLVSTDPREGCGRPRGLAHELCVPRVGRRAGAPDRGARCCS